ncbi:hypothetical protein EMIT048CA2_190098 [Pseudomonas chlororaphis]
MGFWQAFPSFFQKIVLRTKYLSDTFISHLLSAQTFSAKLRNPRGSHHANSLYRSRNRNRWP